MTFGDHLLAWRRYRDYTQAELALKTGIPQPNVAALESGRIEPRLSTLQRLAEALGIASGKLLDEIPPQTGWNRQRIDALVRNAVEGSELPRPDRRLSDALRVVASNKLSAAGRRVRVRGRNGERLVRQLRADLGPQLWAAVIRRLDKYV